jgi:sporulation protein YlmC with PRC-barrel domain
MAHYGNLETQPVSDDVHDVRGTTVRGSDGEKLGTVDDVIFDHDTMVIRYLVVDSGGGLEAGTFLLPADSVYADQNDDDALVADVTRDDVEDSPRYDSKSLRSKDEWKKYEQAFKQFWEEAPVMHLKGSDRIITPPGGPVPAKADSNLAGSTNSASAAPEPEVNVANLFPNRISSVFSDPAPSSGKVTLRPASAARAEEAASGVALLKPHWWESFENYLRINKNDIQAKCSQCESKAA